MHSDTAPPYLNSFVALLNTPSCVIVNATYANSAPALSVASSAPSLSRNSRPHTRAGVAPLARFVAPGEIELGEGAPTPGDGVRG